MRKLGVLRQFLHHVVPQILKPLRALWNELIGFLFLVLALAPAPRLIRDWRNYQETESGLFRIVLSCVYMAVMAYFGIHSFLRARKISRS
jgi:hypothetical protein